jgi:hypothetical protein
MIARPQHLVLNARLVRSSGEPLRTSCSRNARGSFPCCWDGILEPLRPRKGKPLVLDAQPHSWTDGPPESACVTFATRLDGRVLPVRARAVSAGAATGTVAVTGESDVPESAHAGTGTAQPGMHDPGRKAAVLRGRAIHRGGGWIAVAARRDRPGGCPRRRGRTGFPARTACPRSAGVGTGACAGQAAGSKRGEVSVEEPGTGRFRAVRLTAHLDAGPQDVAEMAP